MRNTVHNIVIERPVRVDLSKGGVAMRGSPDQLIAAMCLSESNSQSFLSYDSFEGM